MTKQSPSLSNKSVSLSFILLLTSTNNIINMPSSSSNHSTVAQQVASRLIEIAPILSSASNPNPKSLLFQAESFSSTSKATIPIILIVGLSLFLAVLSLVDLVRGTIAIVKLWSRASDQSKFIKKAIGWRYLQGWRPIYSFLILLFSTVQAVYLLKLLGFQSGQTSRQEIKVLGFLSFLISVLACFFLCSTSMIKSQESLSRLEGNTLEERRGSQTLTEEKERSNWSSPILSLTGAIGATTLCSFGLKSYLSTSKVTDFAIESLTLTPGWHCPQSKRSICSKKALSNNLSEEANSAFKFTLFQFLSLLILSISILYVIYQSSRSIKNHITRNSELEVERESRLTSFTVRPPSVYSTSTHSRNSSVSMSRSSSASSGDASIISIPETIYGTTYGYGRDSKTQEARFLSEKLESHSSREHSSEKSESSIEFPKRSHRSSRIRPSLVSAIQDISTANSSLASQNQTLKTNLRQNKHNLIFACIAIFLFSLLFVLKLIFNKDLELGQRASLEMALDLLTSTVNISLHSIVLMVLMSRGSGSAIKLERVAREGLENQVKAGFRISRWSRAGDRW